MYRLIIFFGLVLVLSPALASTNFINYNLKDQKDIKFIDRFEETYEIKKYENFYEDFHKRFKFINKK